MTLLSARITMPRVGAWFGRFVTQHETALTGSVELESGFIGTVRSSDVHGRRCYTLVVGGDGNLGETLPAKAYTGPSRATVLRDLVGDALDSDVEGFESNWTRHEGTRGAALGQFARHIGAVWRVLDSGRVFVGTDDYPVVEDVGPLLEASPDLGGYIYAAEEPTLRPGVTHDGHRVESVVHEISHAHSRTTVYTSAAHAYRHSEALRLLSERGRPELDFHALYPATVLGQIGQRLSLRPDNEQIRGMGINAVQMRHGLPGLVSVTVPTGTRVMLGFADGDPSKPYAALWEPGTVSRMEFDGDNSAIARVDDTAHGGYLLALMKPTGVDSIQYFPAGAAGDAAAQVALTAATAAASASGGTMLPPMLLELSGGLITSGSPKLFA